MTHLNKNYGEGPPASKIGLSIGMNEPSQCIPPTTTMMFTLIFRVNYSVVTTSNYMVHHFAISGDMFSARDNH